MAFIANCRSKPKCPGEGYVGKDCQCWCPGNPVKKCGGGGGGGGEKSIKFIYRFLLGIYTRNNLVINLLIPFIISLLLYQR